MTRELTADQVWAFVSAGCNAAEVAAYAGVSLPVALAMTHHAIRSYARAA